MRTTVLKESDCRILFRAAKSQYPDALIMVELK